MTNDNPHPEYLEDPEQITIPVYLTHVEWEALINRLRFSADAAICDTLEQIILQVHAHKPLCLISTDTKPPSAEDGDSLEPPSELEAALSISSDRTDSPLTNRDPCHKIP